MFTRIGRPEWIAAGAVTLLALAPVLAPGTVLVYDMVFTPLQPLSADGLGLGSTLPRAVPVDAVVALATVVVPGETVQKLVLLGLLLAACLGAARATPTAVGWARAAAGVLYAWNPYVAERLFIGQWSLLVAYACLPWVLLGALRVRAGAAGGWPSLLVPLGLAAITPTGGLLAVLVACVVLAAGPPRRFGTAVLAALVLNAPWWLPATLHAGAGTSDPAGVAVFATAAENWSGVPGAVLGFGGIWNTEVTPASRTTLWAPLVTLIVLAVAAAGARRLVRGLGGAAFVGLVAAAALGLAIALATWVPGGDAVVRWTVRQVPGAGLLRDGQKWIAPWVLLGCLAFGAGAEVVVGWLRRMRADRAVVGAALVGLLVLPVAALPDLAWGGFGRLVPVAYPDDWAAVRRRLESDVHPGAVLVLPFAGYRAFAWNAGRTVIDPAPRYFPRPVVVDDTLLVLEPSGPVAITGEDPRAAALRDALAAGSDLGELGIGWVLVELDTPGPLPASLLSRLERVYQGETLVLYRVPDPTRPPSASAGRRVAVLTADAAALALFAGALVARFRRRPGAASVV